MLLEQMDEVVQYLGRETLDILDDENYRLRAYLLVLEDLLDSCKSLLVQNVILGTLLFKSDATGGRVSVLASLLAPRLCRLGL